MDAHGPLLAKGGRLEPFGAEAIPGHPACPALMAWWLRHSARANTPNWDLALSCELEGQPGLVLVEAKANVPELSTSGKPLDATASRRSAENHERIDAAIREARGGLAASLPSVSIGRDRHYQLSNRLAHGWKLASLGISTVLLYLGFTGGEGIRDAGEPFKDEGHWQQVFREHLQGVCPLEILNAPVQVGPTRFWVLSRSRPTLEQSGRSGRIDTRIRTAECGARQPAAGAQGSWSEGCCCPKVDVRPLGPMRRPRAP